MILSDLPVSDGVRRRLEASLTHLSHAYIISGPSRQLNETLAERLAAAYVCTCQGDRPCGVCSCCRKVQGGIHPDIFKLMAQEGKHNISVAQVRAMRADAYIRPNEAERKVFIINGAELVGQDAAQNALLKVLEDGPGYAAFIFITQQPQQLLTTIRSRCEILSLAAQKEAADGELLSMAREAAALLLDGEELALAEYMTAIERKKWTRETMRDFLSALEDVLQIELSVRTARAGAILELIGKIRAALSANVGIAHLTGWLAAGRPVKK